MSSIHYRKPRHTHTVCGLIANTDKPRARMQDVTCARCRKSLGLVETWAQAHARKLARKPAKRVETQHTLREVARVSMVDENFVSRGASKLQLPPAFTVYPKPHLRLDDGSFMLAKPLAYTREIDRDNTPAGVRVLRTSPEHITLQIRSTGRMGGRSSKCRFLYSQAMLDAGDVAALIAELNLLLPSIAK